MSWLSRLSEGLKKTSSQLGSGITQIFTTKKLDAAALESLEELLIMADCGGKVAAEIIAEISEKRVDTDVTEVEVKTLLAAAISARLAPYAKPLDISVAKPCIVLVVGVNGNGKTTTLGKLAHQWQQQGKKVRLVAADTFRAAAVEQLATWASRANVPLSRGPEGADPASVVYAGVEAGMQEGADVICIDTAGRLHTKQHLMAELEKILKTIRKLLPDAPHHIVQVLDATTGQNALAQAKAFREVAGVSGLVITKLDGTAKAGVVLALTAELGLPIHALGVGEGIQDLQAFTPDDFATAMVAG